MGTTLVTLSLYGTDPYAIQPMLAPSDLLRDHNPPWLTIVPSIETEEDDVRRLGKLARLLTKGQSTAALLFFYFDDESFHCDFYQSGKKTASCESDLSWAKLGKKLNDLFGDSLPSKAFRYAARCHSLEAQLQLLEETVGVSLYDDPEWSPRTIVRCDTTLQAIKKREALLRKRPKKFCLTEIDREDWPEEMKIRQDLLDQLQPEWYKYDLDNLFYSHMKHYLVPGADSMIAYPYFDWAAYQHHLLFYSGRTKEYRELGPFDDHLGSVVWMTKSGDPVVLLHPILHEGIGCRSAGLGYVSCLREDGTERWRFEPEMHEDHVMKHIYSSADGVITLYASGINGEVKADTLIWQIDAESGELLRSLCIPITDDVVDNLVYAKSISGFVYFQRSTRELVILNEELEEIQRLEEYDGSYSLKENQFRGNGFWDCRDEKSVWFYDLCNKSIRKVPLEIPSYIDAVLPDGRFLGVNEKQNVLTVYDSEGIVVSRCSVPGMIYSVILDGARVCVVELRTPKTNGVICDLFFEEASTHIWRLDPLDTK